MTEMIIEKEAEKWKKKYTNQVNANNLLSDRLRETRAHFRLRENALLAILKQYGVGTEAMEKDDGIL